MDATAEAGARRSASKRRKLDAQAGLTREALLALHANCQHWMEHKRRYCGVARTPESLFCGNHGAARSGGKPQMERVPCPIDPSHTVYVNDLAKHLKVCNRAKEREAMESEPFYCFNCNSGALSSPAGLTGDEDVKPDALLAKILGLYDSLGVIIQVEVGDSSADPSSAAQEKRIEETVIRAVASLQTSPKQLRHAVQDARIAHEMLKARLLSLDEDEASRIVYIELGAGRGVLGQAVSAVSPSSSLVLVERSGQRRKADTQMRAHQESTRRIDGVRYGPFTRLRMDIRHVRLSGLPPLAAQAGTGLAVVIAKHLCGVATDLALRALLDLSPSTGSHAASRAVSIATCCHHACCWDDYTGREWLVAQGFTRKEFDVMRLWSSWAFALGSTREARSDAAAFGANAGGADGADGADDEREQEQEHQQAEQMHVVVRPSGLSRQDMAACGARIKRIFDYGRMLFARKNLGMTGCKIVQYCNPLESPECFLLLGKTD